MVIPCRRFHQNMNKKPIILDTVYHFLYSLVLFIKRYAAFCYCAPKGLKKNTTREKKVEKYFESLRSKMYPSY